MRALSCKAEAGVVQSIVWQRPPLKSHRQFHYSRQSPPVRETSMNRFKRPSLSGYVKDNRIKRFISEITASQGRRSTGGKWTRPDFTLIAVRTYSFTPGKSLEVITFEVKPDLNTALEGVFESLAHSVFAHRSYLAVDTDR